MSVAKKFSDRGVPIHDLIQEGDVVEKLKVRKADSGDRKQGTFVRVWPDAKYFESSALPLNELVHLLRSKAVLMPGVSVTLTQEKSKDHQTWLYKGGLRDYLMQTLNADPVIPLFDGEGYADAGHESFAEGEGAQWCLAFTEDGAPVRESYVNLIPTSAGGTHESGLRDGLFNAVKTFIDLHALLPKGVKLLPEDVFARASPEHKLRIVSALQARGHLVAMTGDGVNDVLALKDADLGIAMGSGAGATRSVAQIVLMDSRFSVMPSVVAEGRRVLGNVERVSDLFLTKSFYAMAVSIATVLLVLPFPFLNRHLTVVTFFTIGAPSFFLALLPNTARFRPGFFARVLRFSVPAGLITALAAYASYGSALSITSGDVNEARSAAVITLFIVAWWVLVQVALPINVPRGLIVGAALVGFVVMLYTHWFTTLFDLTWQPDKQGMIALGLGIVGAALVSIAHAFAGHAPVDEPVGDRASISAG